MTSVLLVSVAALVGVLAAARSTWSPCGLSMLSTVTPLGERGRGRRYRPTAAWFVLGAVLGGASLGVCMAALAAGVAAMGASPRIVAAAAAAACVVAAGSDAGVRWMGLPVHHRQVNERWLDQFRPWVYGMGFGWQIGSGVSTYIMTASVYLLIVLGSLTARPVAALGLGTAFGLVRGLAVVLGRGITTPEALVAFHRRFTAAGPSARWVVVGAELAAAGAMAAMAGWPPAPVAPVAGAAVVLACVVPACLVWTRRHGPGRRRHAGADGDVVVAA